MVGGNKNAGTAVIVGLHEVDRAKQRTAKTNNAQTLADDLGLYYAWAAPPPSKNDKSPEEEAGVERLRSLSAVDCREAARLANRNRHIICRQ